MPLSEHDKQQIRKKFEKLSPEERKEFNDEFEREIEAKRRAAGQPFPKLIKLYVHASEEAIEVWDLNKALGFPEGERWNPVYEVECIVEVPKNPSEAKIIAVDGFMIDYDKPFTQQDKIVKVRG